MKLHSDSTVNPKVQYILKLYTCIYSILCWIEYIDDLKQIVLTQQLIYIAAICVANIMSLQY